MVSAPSWQSCDTAPGSPARKARLWCCVHRGSPCLCGCRAGLFRRTDRRPHRRNRAVLISSSHQPPSSGSRLSYHRLRVVVRPRRIPHSLTALAGGDRAGRDAETCIRDTPICSTICVWRHVLKEPEAQYKTFGRSGKAVISGRRACTVSIRSMLASSDPNWSDRTSLSSPALTGTSVDTVEYASAAMRPSSTPRGRYRGSQQVHFRVRGAPNV